MILSLKIILNFFYCEVNEFFMLIIDKIELISPKINCFF